MSALSLKEEEDYKGIIKAHLLVFALEKNNKDCD